MKLELTCVSKEKGKNFYGYYLIKFRAGSCKFEMDVKESLANKYEIGKNYTIEVY